MTGIFFSESFSLTNPMKSLTEFLSEISDCPRELKAAYLKGRLDGPYCQGAGRHWRVRAGLLPRHVMLVSPLPSEDYAQREKTERTRIREARRKFRAQDSLSTHHAV